MGISPYWDDAHYCCHHCNKELQEEDFKVHRLTTTWKCPYCNGNVRVYASTDKWNYSLIRKYADEIEKDELILLLCTMKSHQVLNVEEANGKVKIALKGHRVVKISEDDWVDCVNGTWRTDETPWKR